MKQQKSAADTDAKQFKRDIYRYRLEYIRDVDQRKLLVKEHGIIIEAIVNRIKKRRKKQF
jgi:hypothetical protein